MNQDEQNLNLLGILHFVLGGITMAGGLLFGLMYIGMGVMALNGKFFAGGPPQDQMPPEMGWFFIVFGVLPLIFGSILGVLSMVAGAKLRKHTARTFCFVIAAIECINMPLGTALGIFTIITLQKESVMQLFGQGKPPATY